MFRNSPLNFDSVTESIPFLIFCEQAKRIKFCMYRNFFYIM